MALEQRFNVLKSIDDLSAPRCFNPGQASVRIMNQRGVATSGKEDRHIDSLLLLHDSLCRKASARRTFFF
jgi:hypothetical protein